MWVEAEEEAGEGEAEGEREEEEEDVRKEAHTIDFSLCSVGILNIRVGFVLSTCSVAVTFLSRLFPTHSVDYLRAVAGCRTVPVEVGSRYTDEGWSQTLLTVNEFIDRYIVNKASALTKKKMAKAKQGSVLIFGCIFFASFYFSPPGWSESHGLPRPAPAV